MNPQKVTKRTESVQGMKNMTGCDHKHGFTPCLHFWKGFLSNFFHLCEKSKFIVKSDKRIGAIGNNMADFAYRGV